MENFGETIINLDKEINTLKISGISMMEDAIDFYKDVKQTIEKFITTEKNQLTIEFELSYFNSSSAKQFIQILSIIENGKGKAVWKYPKDHKIMYDRGRELEILVDVPFEFIGI